MYSTGTPCNNTADCIRVANVQGITLFSVQYCHQHRHRDHRHCHQYRCSCRHRIQTINNFYLFPLPLYIWYRFIVFVDDAIYFSLIWYIYLDVSILSFLFALCDLYQHFFVPCSITYILFVRFSWNVFRFHEITSLVFTPAVFIPTYL